MTNLECTKCGDMVAVTADEVLLPFVCMRCDQTGLERTSFGSLAVGDQEADVDYSFSYDQDAFRDNATVAQFYEDMAPASENEPLTEEGASVENTTALIADLEAQLASANATVAELQNRNDQQIQSLLLSVDYSLTLEMENEDQRATLALLALRVKNLADSRDFYKTEQSDVRLRLSLERNKSWWTKLWEGDDAMSYLVFKEQVAPADWVTKIWSVSNLPGDRLGIIRWKSEWKRYWFEGNAGYDVICLREIADFIERQM